MEGDDFDAREPSPPPFYLQEATDAEGRSYTTTQKVYWQPGDGSTMFPEPPPTAQPWSSNAAAPQTAAPSHKPAGAAQAQPSAGATGSAAVDSYHTAAVPPGRDRPGSVPFGDPRVASAAGQRAPDRR